MKVLFANFCRAHAHNTGQSAIRESSIREMLNFNQFAKVFTHENFPLYGIYQPDITCTVDCGWKSTLICHNLRCLSIAVGTRILSVGSVHMSIPTTKAGCYINSVN